MKRSASAPGKIILSGEYAVVFGRRGIAVPSPLKMTATWEEQESDSKLSIRDRNVEMLGPARAYLENIVAACERAAGKKFHGTLTIENGIPLGRGMGSSTALVIVVCRALLGENGEEQAKQIEDLVNPGGSGLDFAVIWSGRPTLFRRGEPPHTVDLDLSFLAHSELMDTGKPNETTPELVAWMKEKVGHGGPEARSLEDAFDLIEQCTAALLAGEHPLTVFPDHHRAQLALGVVPNSVHELILEIEQAGGAAKVLGAGGRTGGCGTILALHCRRA